MAIIPGSDGATMVATSRAIQLPQSLVMEFAIFSISRAYAIAAPGKSRSRRVRPGAIAPGHVLHFPAAYKSRLGTKIKMGRQFRLQRRNPKVSDMETVMAKKCNYNSL